MAGYDKHTNSICTQVVTKSDKKHIWESIDFNAPNYDITCTTYLDEMHQTYSLFINKTILL